MRKILLILLLFNFNQAWSQLDMAKYLMVPGSGKIIQKSDSSKYMAFDGDDLIDIRKATALQLYRINSRERLRGLNKERFWGVNQDSYQNGTSRNSIALKFQQHTDSKIFDGPRWIWGNFLRTVVNVNGNANVEVIDALITRKNAVNYRYRIIKNQNKDLTGWKIPTVFRSTEDKKWEYCFLADIKYEPNQLIQIEIYNVNDFSDRDVVILNWAKPKKIDLKITVDYRLQDKMWGGTIFNLF